MKKPRYVQHTRDSYYWNPTARMREAGFENVPLGKDRAKAFRKAEGLNAEWDKIRTDSDTKTRADIRGLMKRFKADRYMQNR